MRYEDFIAAKMAYAAPSGLDVEPSALAPHLFPFQRDVILWALRRGRAALFLDTGLGKTACQIEWARHVRRSEVCAAQGRRVLILAPLAVAEQTVREGARWGVEIVYARDESQAGDAGVVITNYEMLERFDPRRCAGIVLDESSILKSYDGATRNAIIAAFRDTPFRLACTATPAPNDFMELGNHAEFLGVKSRPEMLAEFFVHDGGDTSQWRLKGHAEEAFWRWVCAWAVMIRKPSDLGYEDGAYSLPPLTFDEHVVPIEHRDAWAEGFLFAPDAVALSDQRATRRATMNKRIALAAEIVAREPAEPWLIWCELNDEGDGLERAIPGAVQVAGADERETKAERLLGFADGRYQIMITKPSVAGFGMNWQQCARVLFVGASHSYEQTYQAIRRCWRFGQTRPVQVHVIRAETEGAIAANLRRKEEDATRMADAMAVHMRGIQAAELGRGSAREWNEYAPAERMRIPSWLGRAA